MLPWLSSGCVQIVSWLVRAMRPCATREASLVDRRGVMLADTSAVLWEGLSRLVSPKGLAISVACTDSAQGKAQRVWDGRCDRRVQLHDERGAGASVRDPVLIREIAGAYLPCACAAGRRHTPVYRVRVSLRAISFDLNTRIPKSPGMPGVPVAAIAQ